MSFFSAYPPYSAKAEIQDNFISPAWRCWVQNSFDTAGSSGGSLRIVNNSLVSSKSTGDVRLESNSLFFNNLIYPDAQTIDTAKIFYAEDENVLALSDPTELGVIPSTGDIKLSFRTTSEGWVKMDDGTIGSAASVATTRSNADTLELYTLLWANVSDTWCAVSGGRGASALADFNNNKTIALPKVLGRALAFAGAGSGLTSRPFASTAGENLHANTSAETPAHFHYASSTYEADGDTPSTVWALRFGIQGGASIINSSGLGEGHNNMMPTQFLNVFIKL